jgi:predicted metal-dependent phosphoesterase TrpH
MSEAKINTALHIHTQYSACSETRIENIPEFCREKGVDVIVITDHDTIAGALALQAIAGDLRVVIGEEIMTRQGEIIGLFLKHEIEPGMNAAETCERIKEQGGLVYIPHPFDPFKIHHIKTRTLVDIMDLVDIIEVFNAKASLPVFNTIAAKFAEHYGKVGAVGSDAHYLRAIALSINKMDDFHTPQEFLANLHSAESAARRKGPLPGWWVGIKNVLRGEGHKVKWFRKR